MELNLYIREAERLFGEQLYEEAETLLHQILYIEPGAAMVHNYLGWLYLYQLDNTARAETHLRYAMRFDNTLPAPYLHMITLLVRSGRYSEITAIAAEGISNTSGYFVAFTEALGLSHEAHARYRSAVRCYRKAIVNSLTNEEVDGLASSIRRCRRKMMLSWTGLI